MSAELEIVAILNKIMTKCTVSVMYGYWISLPKIFNIYLDLFLRLVCTTFNSVKFILHRFYFSMHYLAPALFLYAIKAETSKMQSFNWSIIRLSLQLVNSWIQIEDFLYFHLRFLLSIINKFIKIHWNSAWVDLILLLVHNFLQDELFPWYAHISCLDILFECWQSGLKFIKHLR